MRAYFFTNMYLSSIQNGIQSAHALHEMFILCNTTQKKMLHEWANLHKTIVVLNGGDQKSLDDLYAFFDKIEPPLPEGTYPWAAFHEDPSALNGALTCIGIVLPEKIYLAPKMFGESFETRVPLIEFYKSQILEDTGVDLCLPGEPDRTIWRYTPWEQEMVKRLPQYRLAI